MNQPDVSYWPCFCDFWGATCAHCKLRHSLDPTGQRIRAVPVEVKPVVKRKPRRSRATSKPRAELLFTGERVVMIDPATGEPLGRSEV